MTGILLCLAVVIVLGGFALVGIALETRADPYVPEAAEAPDPVDEHFKSSPRVVAGTDLEISILIGEMQVAYAMYRRGQDVCADARHEPSPEVKQ